jgi:6-phosphofructokinase 2
MVEHAPAELVTLTMNPALDITVSVGRVLPSDKMRCTTTSYDPGGGGINVARVATVLGCRALAVFPTGGAIGEALSGMLTSAGVRQQTVAITDMTRQNFTVGEADTGLQYRFVMSGPHVRSEEEQQLLALFEAAASTARFVVASGSLPPGIAPDFYQRVADICQDRGWRLFLDTSGAGLAAMRSGVFLLKPSARELSEWSGRVLLSEDELLAAALRIVEMGCAEMVLVSRGGTGTLLVSREGSFRFSAPRVAPGSGVGAGDALVAGVAAGLLRGASIAQAVQLGMAAGAAMLATPGTAVCDLADIYRILPEIAPPEAVSPGRTSEQVCVTTPADGLGSR